MRSYLGEAISRYEYYFTKNGWVKFASNDGCIDEIRFDKKDISVIFMEDLREHITDFIMLGKTKRYLKVSYRHCYVYTTSLKTSALVNDIKRLGEQNNVEDKEVLAYIRFLKTNNFII